MRVTAGYEDFVLKLEELPEQKGLWVRVQASPAGTCRPSRLLFPFDEEESLRVLRSLETTVWRSGQSGGAQSRHVRVGGSEETSPELDPTAIGQALFEALFQGEIREKLLVSLGLMTSRESTDLRIRLLMDPWVADKVCHWPWELLYRAETRDFLGRNSRTPLVRQIEVDRPVFEGEPLQELRVLVVLSNPQGVEPLDVGRERQQLEAALGSVAGVQLRFLEDPTIEKLRRRVREEPFDVLHFVGHGDLEHSGRGTVIFEGDDGRARPISGTVLADVLNSSHQVRLVFLNACETARLPRGTDGHDPFLGTAAALIMAGVPAVVANQFPISDRAALSFSNAFYQNLAAGDPLESAVAEGRKAIFHSGQESWEWATPVLFLGIPDGQLFSIRSEAAPTPETTEALEEGIELFERRHYDRAEKAFGKAFDGVSDGSPDPSAAIYYRSLSRLGGRRPRSARLDVIRKVEAELEEAGYILQKRDREEPAHFWYLRALLKQDFYRFKGMRIQPPTIEETLIEASVAEANPIELERLLNHVPTPPSPVRQAIELRLRGSSS